MSSSLASSSNLDGSDDTSPQQKQSKKPKYSRFTQQELPACKPLLTPGIVIGIFALVAVLFIPIGLASLSASEAVVEVIDRYDADCVPNDMHGKELDFIQNSSTNKTCTRRLTIPKTMKSPVHIYYELDNFYQNHRRYVKSRSDKQLLQPSKEAETKVCAPEGNTPDGKPIVPCGLIAWSLFNDTYQFSINSDSIQVNKKNIAWASDRSHKFSKDVYPKNFQKGALIGGGKLNESIPLSEQEDLIVWMRTAALPTFRKLYGRIEKDLNANEEITVVIENNYNTYSFGGQKKLVLSTATWIGGKNNFLGVAYLTVGGLCLSLVLAFIVLYLFKPRTLGDPSYLSWNRNPSASMD
ncbi:LEM3 (ligand-effect modulator 3) family protein / CDC50 family protein [Rhynchospora pubera]|uniref:ALA-interacting subunit n=1 Tax=Rhynchospora pubera TaxID=906938 RepID=A0AAV8GGE0_9POAL|nr:LEM3 (ligand-effect modulator 3) family protein / CDC50 family protein [Rhynchospora pubera]KAJ4802896.1 LEM3 (ligand-effect modulator 3) family protein / CDC50 family protein [Rhynchospora pubera]